MFYFYYIYKTKFLIMKKITLFLGVVGALLTLNSCNRNEMSPDPQTSANTTKQKWERINLGPRDDWSYLTRRCDEMGNGCEEDVIVCQTPGFAETFFAVLDNGDPVAIKAF